MEVRMRRRDGCLQGAPQRWVYELQSEPDLKSDPTQTNKLIVYSVYSLQRHNKFTFYKVQSDDDDHILVRKL